MTYLQCEISGCGQVASLDAVRRSDHEYRTVVDICGDCAPELVSYGWIVVGAKNHPSRWDATEDESLIGVSADG